MNAVLGLPRVVRVLGVNDCPGASCPHCGAEGRYIVRFQTDDGKTLGAMRGCFGLFPKSRLVREAARLQAKAARYEKNGWELNRADSAALDAIEACALGHLSESSAFVIVSSAKAANATRYRRRP